MRAAPSDTYWYSFDCGDYGDYFETYFDYEPGVDSPYLSFSNYQLTGPMTCEARIEGESTGSFASARWTVLGPSVVIRQADVSTPEFFPVVRDGYADTVTLMWTMTADAAVSVSVSDSLGRSVRTASWGRLLSDYGDLEHRWTWDGLRQDGTVVSAGEYTFTVTATGDDGVSRSVSRTVTAATGVRESGWKTATRRGAQAAAVIRTPGCVAVYPRTGGAVTLDCARGRRMAATWRFTLPADAVSVQHKVHGTYWGREPRVVSKQPSATRYEVKIKLTRGMVTRINKVIVRYKTRTLI